MFRDKETGIIYFTVKQLAKAKNAFVPQTPTDNALLMLKVDRIDTSNRPNNATFNGAEFTDGRWVAVWSVQEQTEEDLRTQLKQRIKEKAKERRDAGIVVNGLPVRTNSEGMALLTGAYVAGQGAPNFVVGDQSVTLSHEQITAIFMAVTSYIQACYTREAELLALAQTTLDVDISEGWPS